MKQIVVVVIAVLLYLPTKAEVFIVNSVGSFNSAQNNANAGDSILWQNGIYEDVRLTIDEDDLHVSAMNVGMTVFTGRSSVSITGSDVVFRGFQFVDGDIDDDHIIDIRGDRVLFEEVNIRDYICYKYLIVREESQYVTIRYCNFENRINLDDQNILSILVNGNHPGFHKIQYCSFKNFDGEGNDFGIEPIRIGVSTQAQYNSRSLVEFCYFTRCDGDGEIISSKASQNVYRYNTFENNPLSELVLRHGSENIVYGNFFMNGKGGVRVREGQHHYIYNNYFYDIDDRPIFLQNEDSDPLDDINIAFNLIHDSEEIRLGGDNGDDPPTNVTFANNIFSDPKDDLFDDPTNDEMWIANISWGDLGFSRPGGIVSVDPQLVENAEGYFSISENSPAIDAAEPGYKPIPQYEGMDEVDSEMLLDIMIENRSAIQEEKDLGCSEYPHEVLVRPHVNEENTGPHYDTSILSNIEPPQEIDDFDIEIFPNPVINTLRMRMNTSDAEDIEISLFDSKGTFLRSLFTAEKFIGLLSISRDVSDLPQGQYMIQYISTRDESTEMSKTFQIVKI